MSEQKLYYTNNLKTEGEREASKETMKAQKNEPKDVFESFEEYVRYLKKAYSLFQDLKKSRDPSFSKIVPEYLEIQFHRTTKSPRLYFPRNKGVVVVQLPLKPEMGPRTRGSLCAKALITFASVVKMSERAMAEEFAISKKLFDMQK